MLAADLKVILEKPSLEDRLDSAEKRFRSQRARIAAFAMHASHDGTAITANARRAFLAKFEDEVDPDRRLTPAERARRAAAARRSYFARLALKSAQVRARKKSDQP